MTPLTVAEARAILAADEALDRTFKEREESGQTLGLAESEAWIKLVASATERVAAFGGPKKITAADFSTPYPGGNEPDFQTQFMEALAASKRREGYTSKRLTDSDLSTIDEMLRVALEDEHWRAGRARFREIREKMIERMSDLVQEART